MNRHSQKGSALLIVLGFLSFMVVSAVAFAIWMRNERLPSSALRRNVANRYLVKGALAQAMSRVDDAIRSHVYPGAWYTNDQNMVYHDKNGCAYDWWESRVFMPPDPEGVGTMSGDASSRYAPVTKTVSVLNLEALGYLPPAIANDVRLLSRSSYAAQWDYFNFDAGRYAFCAVDVSDMLDISKMAADSPRTSAAAARAQSAGQKPSASRFSLAYLFRGSTSADSDNFSNVNGLSQFDQFVHTSPGQGEWSTAPLVSLMDYNLSVGENKMGNLWSPFVDVANGINNTRFFHEVGNVPDSAKIKGAERQPFVTTSWFPPSDVMKSDGTSATPLDLSLHQPFQNGTMRGGDNNLEYTQTAENRVFWETMLNNGKAFCQLDQLTLFDYLDEDDVPLSLAMPCAERVPMITALAPDGNVTVEFTSLTPVGQPVDDTTKMERRETSEANIKIKFDGALKSVLVFPFTDGKNPDSCMVQAFARLVFVGTQTGGGGGGGAGGAGGAAAASVSLRNNGFARNLRPLNDGEWTAAVADNDQFKIEEGSSQGKLKHTKADDCLVVTLAGTEGSWTPRQKINNVDDCWEPKHLQFPHIEIEKPIIRQVKVTELVKASAGGYAPGGKTTIYYQILLNPFDANGEVLDVRGMCTAAGPDGMLDTAFATLSTQYALTPYLVTWVRVKQNNKTVDMVPATYEDDKAFNNVDNTPLGHLPINNALGNSNIDGNPANPSPQRAMPIMRFPGTLSFTYADVSSGSFGQKSSDWAVKSCYAVDPRFNWAPENWWFDAADGDPSGKKWYDAVFSDGGIGILDKLVEDEMGGGCQRGDRANDPFLFVSNLGYLQSVGELAFLPRLSDMTEGGAEPHCVLGEKKETIESGSNNGSLYDGTPRDLTTVATMPCALAAWKSYQSFRTNPKDDTFEFGANLYRRGLVNGSQGFYVNPYTRSQELMLAALANTPLNYWVAGTNYTATAQGKTQLNTFSSYQNLMFSDSGSGYSRMTGRDINKIATFLRRRFEDLANMIEIPQSMGEVDRYVYQKVWEDMFDALDWGGVLDRTVEDVYKDLEDYYKKGDSNRKNYRLAYTEGINGYSDLNHFARGGGKKPLSPSAQFHFHADRAVHKNNPDSDLNCSADPLRGQYAGNTGDTSCYNTLRDIDRKFLHSYWRDCFGNRQQLFLIFVRAESTALGGTGEGTPAQQGGRAVALVWRDPTVPEGADVQEREDNQYQRIRHPHKMRVLFYRQFD